MWGTNSLYSLSFQEESEELSQTEVTRDEVLDLLGKIKTNKSPDPDGIHPRVVMKHRCEMVDLLTGTCHLSVNSILYKKAGE